jgi:hypothetical protein
VIVHAPQPRHQARVAASLPARAVHQQEGTITMSVATISSIERCTGTGTPLAMSSAPVASPTISIWNGARSGVLDKPISACALNTS